MSAMVTSILLQLVVLQLAGNVAMASECNSSVSDGSGLHIVSRQGWGAREPKGTEPMANPVDTVVIHHTHKPGACHTDEACEASMRWIQDFHMYTREWDDVGYSFAIGLDRVYDCRGWSRVGAHTPPFNNRSIGIAFIGDYISIV